MQAPGDKPEFPAVQRPETCRSCESRAAFGDETQLKALRISRPKQTRVNPRPVRTNKSFRKLDCGFFRNV